MKNTEITYKLNCSDYVLHDGDEPIGPVMSEVSIAFDKETGTLHKHGAYEGVSLWLKNAKDKLSSGGAKEMADDLILITGRFPLEDLNKCISISGYVGRMYKKMIDGDLAPEPEFKEASSAIRAKP